MGLVQPVSATQHRKEDLFLSTCNASQGLQVARRARLREFARRASISRTPQRARGAPKRGPSSFGELATLVGCGKFRVEQRASFRLNIARCEGEHLHSQSSS